MTRSGESAGKGEAKRGLTLGAIERPLTFLLYLMIAGLMALAAYEVFTYFGISQWPLPYIYAVLIFASGYFMVSFVSSLIDKLPLENKRVGVLQIFNYAFTFFVYLAALIIVLGLFSISLTGILLAGGFAGIVFGLAAQTVLSAIFSGFAIIAGNIFKVGDEVSVHTWQFGFSFPMYSPKFFSENSLVPAYTGRVTAIRTFYTTVLTNEGEYVKIPNTVMLQAAIIMKHRYKFQSVNVRLEATRGKDIKKLLRSLETTIKSLDFVQKVSVYLEEVAGKVYLININASCDLGDHQKQKNDILLRTADLMERYR